MKRALAFVLLLSALGCHPKPPPPSRANVVFIGDSLTYMIGHNVTVPPAPCDALAVVGNIQRYFPADYLDHAIDGQTTQQMIARFDTQVRFYHPAVVFIEGGGADIFNSSADPYVIEADIELLTAMARISGSKPVLASMHPTGTAWRDKMLAPTLAANQLRFAFAAREKVPIVDYWDTLRVGEYLPAEYDFCDGLHLSIAGYDVLAPKIRAGIQQAQGVP